MSFTTPVPDAAGGQNPQNGPLYVPAGTGVTKWSSGDVNTIKASATTTMIQPCSMAFPRGLIQHRSASRARDLAIATRQRSEPQAIG